LLRFLLCATVAVVACRKGSPPPTDPTPDPINTAPATADVEYAKFQGTWRYLSLEYNGKQTARKVARQFVFIFDGTHYNNARGGKEESRGSFSVDPLKSPAWIDFAENTSVTIYGIYQFDGDRLTVCMHEQVRPTTFEPPPARGYFLFVMERDTPLDTEFPASSLTPEHTAAASELQGVWAAVSFHSDGGSTQMPEGGAIPYTFEGNKLSHVGPTNKRVEIEYRLDPTKNPTQFDQRFTGGTMGPWIAKGIYKVEGDTLTICYGDPHIERPNDFTTRPGDGRMMVVLKRVR
jgi:uncharacterized protein (TIGR03067 family)